MSGDLKSDAISHQKSPNCTTKLTECEIRRSNRRLASKSREGKAPKDFSSKVIPVKKPCYISQKHSAIHSPKENSKRSSTKSKVGKKFFKKEEERKAVKPRRSKNRKEDRKLNQSLNSPNFYNQVTQETYPDEFNYSLGEKMIVSQLQKLGVKKNSLLQRY